MKKSIPKIREREGMKKIHSHNLGKGIRGFHSWEWTGKGAPAHPCGVDMLLSLANRIGMVVVVMFRSNLSIFCNFQQYRLRLRLLWKRNRARRRLISTPLTWSISTCCRIFAKEHTEDCYPLLTFPAHSTRSSFKSCGNRRCLASATTALTTCFLIAWWVRYTISPTWILIIINQITSHCS